MKIVVDLKRRLNTLDFNSIRFADEANDALRHLRQLWIPWERYAALEA
jgi:hypothetical protein